MYVGGEGWWASWMDGLLSSTHDNDGDHCI